MSEQLKTRRPFKRLLVVLIGLGLLVGGAFYSILRPNQQAEVRGWQAYHAGNYEEAIAQFDEALRQHPDSADAYAGRSCAEVALSKWQLALFDSQEAIRLDPKMALAHVAKGNALAGVKQMDQAIAELSEAIRLDPHATNAYFHRARIGFENDLKDVNPLADAEEAAKLDPKFAPAYSLEGRILYGEKKYDAAIAACNKALAIDPREAPALLFRGYARLGKGQLQAGRADIQQALDIDPNLESVITPPKTQDEPSKKD